RDTAQPLIHYISVDPAFTENEKNDPTAMISASVGTGKYIYVNDSVEEFIDSENLVDRIIRYAEDNDARYIIVEDAGQQGLLIADLRRETTIPIIEAYVAVVAGPELRGAAYGLFFTTGIALGALGPGGTGLLVDTLGGGLDAFRLVFGALGILVFVAAGFIPLVIGPGRHGGGV
ncbi:MAG: hypothetical protein ACLFS5_10770, partial [Spirochaetaceae bacterium]